MCGVFLCILVFLHCRDSTVFASHVVGRDVVEDPTVVFPLEMFVLACWVSCTEPPHPFSSVGRNPRYLVGMKNLRTTLIASPEERPC